MEDRANASQRAGSRRGIRSIARLLQLGFYAVTTGILAYLENVVLTELGRSFAEDRERRLAAPLLRDRGSKRRARVSLVVLATFALLRIGRGGGGSGTDLERHPLASAR